MRTPAPSPRPSAGPQLELLRRAGAQIGHAARCRLVVLFGSAARGSADTRPPEDLDLGVLSRGPVDCVALTNRFIRALAFQHVDVTDLSRADPLLLMAVVRDGMPLYEGEPGEFARLASLAARRYADTRKFREAERQEIGDFLSRGRAIP